MKLIAFAGALCAAGTAMGAQTLQLDLNGFTAQATDGANATPFGGVSHTGAVALSLGSGTLQGVAISAGTAQPFVNQGFVGTLTGLVGQINLNNGQVTGGSLTVSIAGGDSYTTNIASAGTVTPFVGGGFKIEGLTFGGGFNDAMFGNVDVTPWTLGSLVGSFLQFNFNPSANGSATADMDVFVQVVPLPPAVASGLGTMAGIALLARMRRRR